MNIKFDIHTHVGVIPASKRANSLTAQVTPEQAAAYLKKYGITHTVILYSDYIYLEELSKLVDTKLYGVKWLNDPEYDSLDQGKPLYYGVKLHSHRGTYLRNSVRYYGVDYTDTQVMFKLLNRMMPGELVYMHTQGSSSTVNLATPKSIFKLACKFPSLKFIIGHAGSYGGLSSMLPRPDMLYDEQGNETVKGLEYLDKLTGYSLSKNSVVEAVEYASLVHNIFLDTSVYFSHKADILLKSKKWCIGSDFPFGVESEYAYDTQYSKFLKHTTDDVLREQSVEAVKYIETPVQHLAAEHYMQICNIEMPPTVQFLQAYSEEDDSFDESFAVSTGIVEEDLRLAAGEAPVYTPHSYLLELSKNAGKHLYLHTGERRGRGRPKTKPEVDLDVPKRSPGRPKMIREGEPECDQEKRGPGRPRLKPLPDPNEPKRGPGRPRLKPLPDPNEPKRGPGRPKFTLPDSIQSSPHEEETAYFIKAPVEKDESLTDSTYIKN